MWTLRRDPSEAVHSSAIVDYPLLKWQGYQWKTLAEPLEYTETFGQTPDVSSKNHQPKHLRSYWQAFKYGAISKNNCITLTTKSTAALIKVLPIRSLFLHSSPFHQKNTSSI
jgi:hypothetical protein